MTQSPSIATAEQSLQRASAALSTADLLFAQGDEWHAVCYFYAAYHTVRAAFMEDPAFRSLKDLAAIKQHHRLDLTMEDKFTARHTGRVAGKERSVGVNDLVRVFYPSVAVEYAQLHGASIDVRYNSGLRAADAGSLAGACETVREEHAAGRLVIKVPS